MLATISSSPRLPSPEDLAQVRARVQGSGSSFYWAMRFLPRAKSDALFAIYAFCREVDDIADGDMSLAEKVAALGQWHRRRKAYALDLATGMGCGPAGILEHARKKAVVTGRKVARHGGWSLG